MTDKCARNGECVVGGVITVRHPAAGLNCEGVCVVHDGLICMPQGRSESGQNACDKQCGKGDR